MEMALKRPLTPDILRKHASLLLLAEETGTIRPPGCGWRVVRQPAIAQSPRRTVRATAFAADAVMDIEQVVRVIDLLDRGETCMVRAPIGSLP